MNNTFVYCAIVYWHEYLNVQYVVCMLRQFYTVGKQVILAIECVLLISTNEVKYVTFQS